MERRRFETGGIRSRYDPGQQAPTWLYDSINDEFYRDPGLSDQDWPEIRFVVQSSPPRGVPCTRSGRFVRWLFANGGMSAVFLGGLLAWGLIAAIPGIR